ncbi:MAG: hypothetical protein CTY12_04405 [Methylotenera sp.]|nr:MAG: hypothetical protein CTY12_04405 [Methylotenera sp.]
MRNNFLILIVIALPCIFTPQLTFAVSTNQTKPSSKAFNAKDAFDLHSTELRKLMLAFYECQPQSLQKNTKVSKEEFVQWVFEGPFDWKFDSIKNTQSIEALTLSFSQEYQGDRVLPLITGLYTMLLQAYGGKNEYTFEAANPHKLNIAAQNTNIIMAKLLNVKHENNETNANQNCHPQILSLIANRVNADAKKLDQSSQTDQKLKPFQMDVSIVEFIPF